MQSKVRCNQLFDNSTIFGKGMPLLNGVVDLDESEIERLNKEEVFTVEELLACSAFRISKLTNISFEKLKATQQRCFERYSTVPRKLSDFNLETHNVYSTPYKKLNDILNNGIRSGEITEIYGAGSSCKTLFCHQMAIHLAINGHRVLYIDTDSSFSGVKIGELLDEKYRDDEQMIMERIEVCVLFTFDKLIETIYALQEAFNEFLPRKEHSDIDVIILDSLITPVLTYLWNLGHPDAEEKVLTTLIQELTALLMLKTSLSIIVVNTEANWFGLLWKNACPVSLKFSYRDTHTEVSVVRSPRLCDDESPTCQLIMDSCDN